MVDEHYRNSRLAQLYNLDSGWSVERDFYVRFAGAKTNSVLDVACGTGLIGCRLALDGHVVVGVDAAPAMLEIARQSPGGELPEWRQSTAERFSLGRQFDRILMTGNAFQVLLSESDVKATFRRMREHLSESGRIAFETRNPGLDWASRWNYEIEIDSSSGPIHERRRLVAEDRPFLEFRLEYEFPDEVLSSESTLRFWSRQAIEEHLEAAGLQAVEVLGDWIGGPFKPGESEEMIFIVEAT